MRTYLDAEECTCVLDAIEWRVDNQELPARIVRALDSIREKLPVGRRPLPLTHFEAATLAVTIDELLTSCQRPAVEKVLRPVWRRLASQLEAQ